jgi:hypothetical protein
MFAIFSPLKCRIHLFSIWILSCLLVISTLSKAQMTVDTTQGVTNLVDKILVGTGVRVGNIKCSYDTKAIAYFKCPPNKIGIRSGLLLSTGLASNAIGPNTSPGITSNLDEGKKRRKDRDLNKLSKGQSVYDITYVEFDFVPMNNKVTFEYAFGSEEYKEYVGSQFNDVFGMRKQNVALLPNDKKFVAINNINQKVNKGLFVDNDPFINKTLFKKVKFKPKLSLWQKISASLFGKRTKQGDSVLFSTNKLKSVFLDETLLNTFQYDGFTKKLKVTFFVVPFQKYHIKMIIGDVGDAAFDSGVFIEEKSFQSVKDTLQPKFSDYPDKSSYFKFDSAFGKHPDKIAHTEEKEKENSEEFDKTIVYFPTNSFEIPDTCYPRLKKLAEFMKKHPGATLSLTGFTDNIGSAK